MAGWQRTLGLIWGLGFWLSLHAWTPPEPGSPSVLPGETACLSTSKELNLTSPGGGGRTARPPSFALGWAFVSINSRMCEFTRVWARSRVQPWPVTETTGRAWGKLPVANSQCCPHSTELQAQHGLRTFRLARTCCYEALLVDEERGRLFVGAENHVASLSLDNISKRAKKVPGTHSCGTAQGKAPGLPGETRGVGPGEDTLAQRASQSLTRVPSPPTSHSWPGRPLWNGEKSATGRGRTLV